MLKNRKQSKQPSADCTACSQNQLNIPPAVLLDWRLLGLICFLLHLVVCFLLYFMHHSWKKMYVYAGIAVTNSDWIRVNTALSSWRQHCVVAFNYNCLRDWMLPAEKQQTVALCMAANLGIIPVTNNTEPVSLISIPRLFMNIFTQHFISLPAITPLTTCVCFAGLSHVTVWQQILMELGFQVHM